MPENVIIKYSADTSDLKGVTAELNNLSKAEQEVVKDFEKANAAYNTQISRIKDLERQQEALNSAKTKLQNEPKALAEVEKQIKRNATQVADYTAKMTAQSALIQTLAEKESKLKVARDKANDPSKIKDITTELGKVNAKMDQLVAETRKGSEGMNILSNAVRNVGTMIAANFAINRISSFAKSIVETTAKMEGLNTAIEFSSKGHGAAALASLTSEADRLGLVLEDSIAGFQKFSAAFAGTNTPIQKQLQLYNDISLAVGAMKLPADKAAQAFNALSQMVSKGKVQAEELRGQLGDALPGAFGLAAKSMGKTTAEFNKMLETGQVITNEFLPKFAAEIKRAYEDEAAGSADSLTGALNRNENAWMKLRIAIGNSTGIFKDVIVFTGNIVGGLANWITGQKQTEAQAIALNKALTFIKLTLSLLIGLLITYNKTANDFVTTLGKQAKALLTAKGASDALNASLKIGATLMRGIGIGLLIALLTNLATKLFAANAQIVGMTRVQDDYNKRIGDATAKANQHTDALNKQFAIAKDATKSTEERGTAIAKINVVLAENNQALIKITDTEGRLNEAQKAANKSMRDQIMLYAKADILKDYHKRLFEAEQDNRRWIDSVNKATSEMSYLGDRWESVKQIFTTTEFEALRNKIKETVGEMGEYRKRIKDLESDPGVLELASQVDTVGDSWEDATGKAKKFHDENARYEEEIRKLRADNSKTLTEAFNNEWAVARMASEKRIEQAKKEAKEGRLSEDNLNKYILAEREHMRMQVIQIDKKYLDMGYEQETLQIQHLSAMLDEELRKRVKNHEITAEDANIAQRQRDVSRIEETLRREEEYHTKAMALFKGNELERTKLENDYIVLRDNNLKKEREATAAYEQAVNDKLLNQDRAYFQARQNLLKSGDFADQTQAIKEQYIKEMILLVESYHDQMAVKNQSNIEKANIQKQFQQNMIALQRKAADEILQAQLAEYAQETQNTTAHQNHLNEAWKEYYAKLRQQAKDAALADVYNNANEYNTQQQALKKRLDDGIDDYAEYQRKLDLLNKSFRANDLNADAIAFAKKKTEYDRQFAAGEIDETAYQDNIVKLNEEYQDKILTGASQYAIKRADIDKREKEAQFQRDIEFAAKKIGIAQQFGEQLSAMANALVQQQQQDNQAALAAIDAKYDKEIARAKEKQKVFDSIQKKTIEQEKSNQANLTYTARLEQQKADAEEKQKEKNRKDMVKVAEFQKAIQIAQAIMSTAQAVIGVFAQSEFLGPFVFPLAATIGAAGAAQLALIANTPIPAYAEGGEIPWFAGEANKDSVLARLMPGERIMTKQDNADFNPTLRAIHAHDVDPAVLNDFVTANRLGFGMRHSDIPAIQGKSGPTIINVTASEELLAAMARMEQTSVHVSADANGFSTHVEKGLSKTKYLNNRYSSK